VETKKFLLTKAEANHVLEIGDLLIEHLDPKNLLLNVEGKCEKLGEIIGLSEGTLRNYLVYTKEPFLPIRSFAKFCEAVNKYMSSEFGISKKIDSKTKKWLDNFSDWKIKIEQENHLKKRIEAKIESISRRPLFIDTVEDRRFTNTVWYGFERKLENGKDKILKTKFKFGSYGSGKLIDVIFFTENSESAEWKGKAFISHTDATLSISLTTEQGSHYLHFLFRIETRVESASLWIGHKTYSTEEYGNIVSKTILLQKEGSKDATPNFGILDYKSIDVPRQIAEFLSLKEKNRMSSPHGDVVINSLDKLISWSENKRSEDIKFKALFGNYQVYYKINEKEYIDSLIIEIKNKKPHAKYTHIKDDDEIEIHEGEVSINFTTKRLTLFLHGPIIEDNPVCDAEDDVPLILILQIPPKGTTVIEVLTGIITGSKDNGEGIVARLTMLVKCDDATQLSDERKTSIEKYFKLFQNQSKVRPPKGLIISKFKELGNLIDRAGNLEPKS
jgi:hypothetical protein